MKEKNNNKIDTSLLNKSRNVINPSKTTFVIDSANEINKLYKENLNNISKYDNNVSRSHKNKYR